MTNRSSTILALVAALTLPAAACAQEESLDQVLSRTLGSPGVVTSSPLGEGASEAPICRTMTDLAQRGRRERVCMTQDRWNVLITAARRPQSNAAPIRLSALRSSSRAR